MNTGWREIGIHCCYSLVKIAFVPICACKNNRRMSRHNASTSRSRDVTDQLWWRHNAKSEIPSLATMAKWAINDLFFSGIVCWGHEIACKKWHNTFVAVNNDFWVTREAICQWFSLVTSYLVKIIGQSPHSWHKNRYSRLLVYYSLYPYCKYS